MDHTGHLQIRILHRLWDRGPALPREVLDSINADRQGTPLSYSTVLTVLRGLERRGLLAREAAGRAHRYRPAVERAAWQRATLRQLRREVFRGDAGALLAALGEDEEVESSLRSRLPPRA